MKNWISALCIVFLGASLASCSTMSSPNPDSSKEYIGMFSGAIIGGAAGGVIGQKGGGRVTDIVIGAVVGGIVGALLGTYMDDQDRDKAKIAAYKNANPSRVNAKQQQANNWQRASNPLVPPVTMAEKTAPGKKQMAERRGLVVAKTTMSKKEKPEKEVSVNDKILSLWRHLPSTQWFVNDVDQEDVG